MTIDGGLRKLFQKNLPEFHWTSIETGSTGRGIPDANYCCDGIEGWIEFKQTTTNRVGIAPEQCAWIERRVRAGGRVWIAVRKRRAKSARLAACDELWIFSGDSVRDLMVFRLLGPNPRFFNSNGPGSWAWENVKKLLIS